MCQKDALIIAVTSVFFVSFFLGQLEHSRTFRTVEAPVSTPLPRSPGSFGIIDLGENCCQIFEE